MVADCSDLVALLTVIITYSVISIKKYKYPKYVTKDEYLINFQRSNVETRAILQFVNNVKGLPTL